MNTEQPMRENKIRFHWIVYDWFKEVVDIKYMVGTQLQGGYEDSVQITFRQFQELLDTSKLQSFLSK